VKEKHEVNINIRVGVVTISTSRWEKFSKVSDAKMLEIDDPSGKLILEELGKEFSITGYKLVPDDEQRIIHAVKDLLERSDVVVTTGGTGICPKDVTIEALEGLVEKKLDGFGEIFRMLSYNEVGAASILSRAFAGVINGKAIFCLPGSQKAVKLGLKLIKPSLRHIISHARGLK
jgi:molybdenum cofactor biosynthesis protein B